MAHLRAIFPAIPTTRGDPKLLQRQAEAFLRRESLGKGNQRDKLKRASWSINAGVDAEVGGCLSCVLFESAERRASVHRVLGNQSGARSSPAVSKISG